MEKQKVWFITGASKGMGAALAGAVLASGDQVVATVRKKPEELAEKLGNAENLLVVVLDVTNESQIKAGVKAGLEKFGRIDVLVNNAGYGLVGSVEEISDAEVRKQYDTNVFGLLNVTRAVLPVMRGQQSGHIINVSSLFGYQAQFPGLGLYGSTKYAVEGISEGLALEVQKFGIHVTAAAPGLFRTDFSSKDSYQSSSVVLGAYDDTVGQLRKSMADFHGSEPGDPVKLANVVVELARSKRIPLHLPIGGDAVDAFTSNSAKLAEEISVWEDLSRSTNYDKN